MLRAIRDAAIARFEDADQGISDAQGQAGSKKRDRR
jgi:hypothetical protein